MASIQVTQQDLELLGRVGRSLTTVLDLDNVLKRIVIAAVEFTGAEEGSVLLVDRESGELYMRAAQNFDDEFVRTFRLPVNDSLAGEVLSSGQPILINQDRTQKIKTAYFVHSLIYVPLKVSNQVIGVLGVDNRKRERMFSENHVVYVSTLADYAAIAIENASLYSYTASEQNKFETILNNIEDGVIVIDYERRVVYVNKNARIAFDLDGQDLTGERFQALFKHPDLQDLVNEVEGQKPRRAEVVFEDGRVFNARLTHIKNVGYAISLQDISYLKELDRIKSDFVNAVSHDLRSPLTAILGYVELIERAGEINEQQRDFIKRVQASVYNITDLISDLLDLGRIESGFDVNKELISFAKIVHQVYDDHIDVATENQQAFNLSLPEDLPFVMGNPTRLRQMLGNLVGNAIKYTPVKGRIMVRAQAESGQIIVQVADNGPGIPLSEQTFIFDKFYRASNISGDTTGTGLGLAIVKSIVENHQGRIWVESRVGQGSMFTVVLPVGFGV